MHAFVTGAAGFIGSNLADALLARGDSVTGYDNFSTGNRAFLTAARLSTRFRSVEGDLLDSRKLANAMSGADVVFHLAANADVRFGLQHPRKDLEQNTLATFNVLEAMRTNAVRILSFASTAAVYGESPTLPTPEDAPFPIQTSLYGASKAACEGLITAYSEGYGLQSQIFRFVGVLGERYTHGHVFDFVKRLLSDPSTLQVLGDGMQRKSYLYVADCVDGMLTALDRVDAKLSIFNLGTDEYCRVSDSVAWITTRLGVAPRLSYSGGNRGWIGDNSFVWLDTGRMRSHGWQPKLGIREAVERTVDWLIENKWVFQDRAGGGEIAPGVNTDLHPATK
jgi:UDP-glucose 4-epimerase